MKALRALALSLLAGSLLAQTASLMPTPKFQGFDASGYPLAGGLVFTCVAGSSCPGTPLATYTDSTAGTANANPVVLDGGGFANIWLGSNNYKIVVENAAGVVISTTDNVSGANTLTNARLTTPTITNPAITGGTISGAAISGGSVSGATITGGSVTSPTVSAGTYSYAPISTQYLITEGDSTSAGAFMTTPATQAWGAQLSQLAFFKNRATFINAAISGSTCASMTARYVSAVKPYKPNGSTITKAYLMVLIGRNDLALGAAAMESCDAAYISQAVTDGFAVTQATILPATTQISGPVGSPTCNITAIQQTGTTVTFTCANTFTVGQSVFLQSLSYGSPYVNLTYFVSAASSTQWSATVPTGTLALTATTGLAVTPAGWTSWDPIAPAQEPVLEAVNDYLRHNPPAGGVIDFAQMMRDPNILTDTFDGTHPTVAFASLMAQAAHTFFQGGSNVLPALPAMNSGANPIFSGALSASSLGATGAAIAPQLTVPNLGLYVTSGSSWMDSYNPPGSAFYPLTTRALNFNFASGTGVTALAIDASQNTTLSGSLTATTGSSQIIGNTFRSRLYIGASPNTWPSTSVSYNTGTGAGIIESVDATSGSPVAKPLYLNTGGAYGSGPVAIGGGAAGQAVCFKSDAKTLGYCSTQPNSSGACTCN